MTQKSCVFNGVAFAYPDGTEALAGVTFEVAEAERVGIVGPNGAGKSTLLAHLNGILLPRRGRVEIQGLEVNKKNLKEIRRRVGLVFQNPDDQLFCATVLEDVAFGPRNMELSEEEVQQRVATALDIVSMAGFENRSSHHLSFGQKKRIAVATVLSMMPRIWAFDEPSANLDQATQRAIEEFIMSRPETVLIVTQDILFAARTCDRLIILDQGRVAADGLTDDILRNAELLRSHNLDFERNCRICEKVRGARSAL